MRIRQVVPTLAALALFTSILSTGRAAPNAGWKLEEHVPASTLALLSAEDIGTWGQRFGETAMGRLLKEPEMQAFLKPATDWVGQATSQPGAAGGPLAEVPPIVFDVLKQLQGLHGQASIALISMDMKRKAPEVVASLDFGPHANDFLAFLARLQTEIDPQGEHIKTTQKDGRTWWSVDADGMPVTATTSDTTFILGTSPSLVEQAVSGAADGALAASADFRAGRAKSGTGSPMLGVHVNLTGVLGLLGDEMGAEGRRMLQTMGVDKLRSFSYTSSFSGDGFTDSMSFQGAMDQGLMSVYQMEPLTTPKLLPLLPSTAFLYGEGNLDLAKMYVEVRRIVSAMGDRESKQIDEALAKITAELGVDLEKDLLPTLASGIGFYAAFPETGGMFPEVALMLTAKDAGACERVMDRLAAGIAGAVNEKGQMIAGTRTIDYRGKKLHLFDIQKARGDDVVPFTPTWTFLGDRLLLTFVPHVMKEILLRSESGGGGLAGQEDFQSVWKQKPSTAGWVEYIDLQAALSLLYDTGVPVLQAAVKPNMLPIPFALDWAQLPAARTVRPYLRSMAAFTSGDKDGMTASVHGPLPMAPLLVGVVGVGAFAATQFSSRRAMATARSFDAPVRAMPQEENAWLERQEAASQVRGLVEKVEIYKVDKGALPKDLGDLVMAELLDRVPTDPWGHAYRFRVVDAAARTYVVESPGNDGRFGSPDDVTSEADSVK